MHHCSHPLHSKVEQRKALWNPLKLVGWSGKLLHDRDENMNALNASFLKEVGQSVIRLPCRSVGHA
ncbi:hypothetical protein ACQZV8_05270 [Magnetococcales bacterium HHB-1]